MEPFDSYRERIKQEYEKILKEMDEKYKKLVEDVRKSLYSNQ